MPFVKLENKISNWFTQEPKSSRFILAILVCLLIQAGYLFLFDVFLGTVKETPEKAAHVQELLKNWYFPLLVFGEALGEEIVFRLMPLACIVRFYKNVNAVLLVAVISSISFGMWHGGLPNILIEGIGGFIYCILWLKSGGWSGKILKPTLATFAVHIFLNGGWWLYRYFM